MVGRVRPGCQQLGRGTELVDPDEAVTTVDIDPGVIEQARRCLALAGYEQIRDEPAAAPWERIVVTVGLSNIPPTWVEQLTPGGRIVKPPRVPGVTKDGLSRRASYNVRQILAYRCQRRRRER